MPQSSDVNTTQAENYGSASKKTCPNFFGQVNNEKHKQLLVFNEANTLIVAILFQFEEVDSF